MGVGVGVGVGAGVGVWVGVAVWVWAWVWVFLSFHSLSLLSVRPVLSHYCTLHTIVHPMTPHSPSPAMTPTEGHAAIW